MSRDGRRRFPDPDGLHACFDAVLREARGAEAVVDGGLCLTFGEWWRRSGIAATALSDLGVGPGDVVCLVLPSSADFAVCYVAALRLNAIVTAANPRLGRDEIAHIIGRTAPAVIVTAARRSARRTARGSARARPAGCSCARGGRCAGTGGSPE
ncbi:AMP-binding protein [Spirillospora sp. CA-255316]